MLSNSNIVRHLIAILFAQLVSEMETDFHVQKRILILSWNVVNGDNNPDNIAETLEKLEGYYIIGFEFRGLPAYSNPVVHRLDILILVESRIAW